MSKVAEHYENLLADHYSWMFDDFDAKAAQQKALLENLGIGPGDGAKAIDLGCGSGFQSLALAELGYRVLAVDSSEKLLTELARRAGEAPIECAHMDLRSLDPGLIKDAALVVCMGDTLTHLENLRELRELFGTLAHGLQSETWLILTFRDLSNELTGTERFIPLRSDGERIMTCFLEYEEDRVLVHDLVHVRDGYEWRLKKSSYAKLRLSGGQVADLVHDAGFGVDLMNTDKSMVTIQASRN